MAAAPAASAATEFGDNCTANGGAPNYTFVSLSAPGDPLPMVAPVSGVITQWKSNVGLSSPPTGLTEALTVLRPTASSLQFTVVGQSAYASINNGPNSFPTRIPVQTGDHLGLAGSMAPLYCQTASPGDAMGILMSVLGPGATGAFTNTPGYRVPAAAVIEPDADGDGYGDETQDKCPQSAAIQAICPVAKLSLSKVVKKRSVKVFVSTDNQASVTVVGRVRIDGKKLTVKGGTKTLKAGKIVAFQLAFPAKLKSALEELPASRALTLKIVASAPNVAGTTSTKKLTVKLEGRG